MGGPGSGGHNRKPLSQHVLAGTWRADRHAKLVSLPRSAGPPPAPPAGLSERSSALWAELLLEFSGWAPHELRLLEAALLAADRAEQCRTRIARDGLLAANKRAHPLLRTLRHEEAFMAHVFNQLRLNR